MTSSLFQEWLADTNQYFRRQRRKVVLLIDNAPGHGWDRTMSLDNVKVVFLPPNTTSRLQPMDAGVIANFKVKYRAMHLQRIVDFFDEHQKLEKINVRQAIDFVVQAWEKVEAQTIANCWQSTGLLSNPSAEAQQEVEQLTKNMQVEVRVLISELPTLSHPMSAEAYLNAEVELKAQTSRAWTDDEIIDIVLGKPKEEHITIIDSDEDENQDNNDSVQAVPWSSKQVLESLEQIAFFLAESRR